MQPGYFDVVTVTLLVPEERKELVSAEMWDFGTEGVIETDVPDSRTQLQCFFPSVERAQAVLDRYPDARIESVPTQDWSNSWQSAWQPLRVGERFHLVPVWMDEPTPEGRMRLPVHAGRAFGTGQHATTQLCLEALERHLQPGMRLVDLGTGTGLLAVAGHLLGATGIVGCDNDPEAIECAYVNCLDDAAPVSLFVGTSDAIRANSADCVVANISPDTCAALASELARILRQGGIGILSGFELQEASAVASAMKEAGLTVLAQESHSTWACLVGQLT